MISFQRAHSPEQREVRRAAILRTATEMLGEMRAADISLNELARRVGLAKSNVLRYFESREAILLELYNTAAIAWTGEVAARLREAVDRDADPAVRADQIATTTAESIAEHPMLCDLISTQAAVLEHNISTEKVLRYKRNTIANVEKLSRLVLSYLPELGSDGAWQFVALLSLLTGAIWTHANPSAAVLAAYDADPAVAQYRLDFRSTLRESLQVVLSGLLARA